MSEIKPCPFCGSNEVEPFKKVNHELFGFCCWNCGAESGFGGTEKRAIEKWNQRPYDYDMPAIVKKVQRMEAALKIFANPESWNDEGYSSYTEFPFVKGDPIQLAKEALGESCKRPE